MELARQLVDRGRNVAVVARRTDILDGLVEELSGRGRRVEALACDLADREARAGLADRLAALNLGVDLLVNNAGISTMGPVASSDADAELQMVEVDVAAVVHLCSLFVPAMVRDGRGAVLNVASTAAFQPIPGQAGYAASKAFVLAYSQAMAAELAGTGVGVTVLCPGPVDTGFGEAAGLTSEQARESLPDMMWIPANDVARTALDGLEIGRQVVIPGAVNRATALVARFAPRRLLLPLVKSRHPSLRGSTR